MLALGANLNPLAARADEIFQGGVQVQRIAHLVKVSHLQISTLSHFATAGLQLSQNEFEQSGFARTIGAHQPHFVASQQGGAEVVHHHFVAKSHRHIGQFGDDFAAGQTRVHTCFNLAHGVAPGLPCGPKFL